MTLDIVTSDLLAPLPHGFFARRGGASTGVYHGLNCGIGSDDQQDVVSLNRSRVAAAMRVPATNLVGVHQIHSPDVIRIDTPLAQRPKADAMVSATPGLALSVLTADCQPVLFADAQAGVIGAAHAGWKGALYGVLDNTIDAMVDLGAQRDHIVAVIGPCISQSAYEVGPEFLDDFLMEDSDNTRFFANGAGDKYMFDLPAYGLHRLRSAGVQAADWTGHCTYADPNRFYSYRRKTHLAEADYGRQIACIALPG